MPSSFPGAIDSFVDPLSTSPLSSPSHALQHQNINDAVEKVEQYMGLVFIKKVTFTAATAASPANVDTCFTSLYDNYRIVINSVYSTTPATNLRLRLRIGATTPAQSNWANNVVYTTPTGGPSLVYFANQAAAIIGNAANYNAMQTIELGDPFTSKITNTTSNSIAWGTTDNIMTTCGNGLINTTSYDGFQLYTDAGTITGTVNVYGYRK